MMMLMDHWLLKNLFFKIEIATLALLTRCSAIKSAKTHSHTRTRTRTCTRTRGFGTRTHTRTRGLGTRTRTCTRESVLVLVLVLEKVRTCPHLISRMYYWLIG
jgi:hypothetical protein